ncbi:LacI family transcriptional regulator [Sphingomonas spermidinifaciens]|uniref:LacI family transcriptional regulator n=2 Tax=Sphingomonas spermidinifaciens TaxID=1141889 RepID=A0A2A4B3F9_9SPHN|nr:LacI family DNA-binding transcriptional regulator [Sphingomonas spermidinifaciens]PCD02319.1 LacI family transcriptional regulator [Sphingomonas spermidinifaciens]
MGNATIRDVARVADVSVASASRALNGRDNVRPELRARVEAAAQQLGYVPHAGARSLSLSRTGTIGVVLPDLHGEFFSEFVRGMDREVSARGLHLLLSNMHADPEQGIEALRAMRGRVDGLVVMAPQVDADVLGGHLPPSVPAILVNCAPNQQGRAELRIDNAAGAAAMVAHLVATGRRRIVHIAGPAGNIDADGRRRGYAEAMARAGLSPRIVEGQFDEASGAAAALALAAESDHCEAIFAANDMMAIGALVALRDAGVRVPDEIAIAGFDDVPLARLVSPALTTLRVGIAEAGARAIVRLAALVDGAADHFVEEMVPALVPRDSTAATHTTRPRQEGPGSGERAS